MQQLIHYIQCTNPHTYTQALTLHCIATREVSVNILLKQKLHRSSWCSKLFLHLNKLSYFVFHCVADGHRSRDSIPSATNESHRWYHSGASSSIFTIYVDELPHSFDANVKIKVKINITSNNLSLATWINQYLWVLGEIRAATMFNVAKKVKISASIPHRHRIILFVKFTASVMDRRSTRIDNTASGAHNASMFEEASGSL